MLEHLLLILNAGNTMDYIAASFLDGIFENEYIWVFDNRIQAICKINITNFNMEIVSFYKGERKFFARKIFKIENKFYLVGRESSRILIYNRNKQEEYLEFSLQNSSILDDSEKYIVFLYGTCIYFLPQYIGKEIICFDTSIKKYFTKQPLKHFINGRVKESSVVIQYSNQHQGAAWFVLRGTGFYGQYNFVKEKLELFQIENSESFLSGCCFDGDNVWLVEINNGHVICAKEQVAFIPQRQYYSNPFPVNEGIILLPANADRLMFIEKESFKMSVIEMPFDRARRKQLTLYPVYGQYGNCVFMFPVLFGTMYIFNKKTLQITQVVLKCEEYIKKCFSGEKVLLNEEQDINLKQLLQTYERSMGPFYKEKRDKDETGKIIWKTIISR